MNSTRQAEPLFQTPDEQSHGTVTFRVFIDDAWRNIVGRAEWKSLPQKELIEMIEKVYYTPK